MGSMIEVLTQQLGGDNLKAMSRHLGSDEKATGTALSAALPMLLGALAKNSARPDGAESLYNALAKDHDGAVLDDLPGHLTGAQQGPGDGILKHAFGAKRGMVESGVSKASGLDGAAVGKLMTMVAPLVMGALGREQRQKGLNASSLAGLLDGEAKQADSRSGGGLGSMLQMLDADKDGKIGDDIAKLGGGFVKKLFGGK